MKNNILIIIFNLKHRESYVSRYIKLLNNQINENEQLNLLIICEENIKEAEYYSKNLKIHFLKTKDKVSGMNDFFRSILKADSIIKNFKYLCFVEDDNFIFPRALQECAFFLEKNKDFIACNGESFLYSKKSNQKFYYLNYYFSPEKLNSDTFKSRLISYNGSLCYYSLFRYEYFVKILQKINLIKDHNLSEVFFNYFAIKCGKIKKINNLYLAREYPRPKIYNIPDKFAWLKNHYLIKDINIIINELSMNCENKKFIIENSILKYIAKRLSKRKNSDVFQTLKMKIKKYLFYLKYSREIKSYLKEVNSI